MTQKLIDVAGGQYVEAVALVDAAGNALGSTNPLSVSASDTNVASAHIVSAATTNATVVKASAANLYSINAINTATADRYVKVYNKGTAPVVGTDAVIKTVKVPANGVASIAQSLGINLGNGLAIAIVAGAADADATAILAGEVILDIDFA